jgi:large subunit ribosomal protein L32
MGLPGHRRTSSHKRRRAAHFALAKSAVSECPKCKASVLPHRACKTCGYYRGRAIVDTARAALRLVKRARAKAPAAEHNHEGHDHDDHDHEEKPKA